MQVIYCCELSPHSFILEMQGIGNTSKSGLFDPLNGLRSVQDGLLELISLRLRISLLVALKISRPVSYIETCLNIETCLETCLNLETCLLSQYRDLSRDRGMMRLVNGFLVAAILDRCPQPRS